MSDARSYALAAALALGTLALLHGVVWWRQRQRFSACFSLAYLSGALFYVLDPATQPVAGRTTPLAVLTALPSAVLLTFGMADYAGLAPRAAARVRRVALAVAAPMLALGVAALVSHVIAKAVFAGFLLIVAGMAAWAMRREPGHGHGLVFASMLTFPLLVPLGAAGWLDLDLLRYTVAIPLAVAGATLLTIGLLRAQRAATHELDLRLQAERRLRALTETLEQQVSWRTADLHEMVAALESFNRSVSHDLRGPLGGIAGLAELASLALGRGDAASAQQLLAGIRTQAESAAELVAALLALARVDDATLSLQPVDLQRFVPEVVEQLRLQARCELPVQVAGALPVVQADAGLLRQVFVNLIDNAVKFSGQRDRPRVEIGASVEQGQALLYVRDNGIGFDQAQATGLFEPFRRLHGARYEGHGLGLSIVKRIVERHGGHIWARSRPEGGATFTFTLRTA